MRTNSKNKPKRRNLLIMSSKILRKNTPHKYKKSKEDMKVKTESSNARLMNSKINMLNFKMI